MSSFAAQFALSNGFHLSAPVPKRNQLAVDTRTWNRLIEVVVMVCRGRRSSSRVHRKPFTSKRPVFAALDFSSVHDDYDSYTMLLRVMLRLTDANNSVAEIFSYAAFKPCISVLMTTLSRTVALPHASLDDSAVEKHKIDSVETIIDIDASPNLDCPSDPNMMFPKSCVRSYSASNRGASSKLNVIPSATAYNGKERDFGVMSRSDAVFLLGVVVCFLLAAKLIAQTSTLPIAGSMKWYKANPGMQV